VTRRVAGASSVSRRAVSGNCALRRRAADPRADSLAMARSRRRAHRRAIDFTRNLLMIFVIADVSWQFS